METSKDEAVGLVCMKVRVKVELSGRGLIRVEEVSLLIFFFFFFFFWVGEMFL